MRDLYFIIIISFFRLLSVCCEASVFLAAAHGLPFGGDRYCKICADGQWQSASAGKKAVSVRAMTPGFPLNPLKAQPGSVSPRGQPRPFLTSTSNRTVDWPVLRHSASNLGTGHAERCYRPAPVPRARHRVEHAFARYEQLTAQQVAAAKPARKRRK